MRGLNMELHGHMSEFMWGLNLMSGLPILAVLLLGAAKTPNRTPPAGTQSPIGVDQIVAGTVAYGYYIAAAMMAGDHLLNFLRDHLFDGFAPAALVVVLMFRIRNARLSTVGLLFLLYLQSAAVFGLIAAAAVFTSGKDNFVPVLYAALIGGFIFPLVVRGAKPNTEGTAGDAGQKNLAAKVPESGEPGVGSGTEPGLANAPDQPGSSPVTAERPVGSPTGSSGGSALTL
jgi:hypothetical protein